MKKVISASLSESSNILKIDCVCDVSSDMNDL